MQSEFSFRINGEPYQVGEASLNISLGNFLKKNSINFSNKLKNQGAAGTIVFLCDHDSFGEPCHYFISPFRTNLVTLADRDLVVLDFIGYEPSEFEETESCSEEGDMSIGSEAFIAEITSEERYGYNSFSEILTAMLDCSQQKFTGAKSLLSSKPFFTNDLSSKVYLTNQNEWLYCPVTVTEAIKIRYLRKKAHFFQGNSSKSTDLEQGCNVFISLERIAELREIESDGEYWKVGSSVLLREFAQRFIDKFLSIQDFISQETDLHFLNRFSIRDVIFNYDSNRRIVDFLISVSAKLIFEDLDDEKIIPLEERAYKSGSIAESGQELLTWILIPKSVTDVRGEFKSSSLERVGKILQVEDQIKEIIFDK